MTIITLVVFSFMKWKRADFGLVAIYVGDEKVVYASEAEGCVCYGNLDMESIAAIKQIVSYSDDIEGVG